VIEFGEDLLDRIEIGTVGRQEEQMGCHGPDGVAGGLAVVTAEVVDNDDLALCQGGRQHFLDIEHEELAVDGGRRYFETLPARSPAAQRVLIRVSSIKTRREASILALMGLPADSALYQQPWP